MLILALSFLFVSCSKSVTVKPTKKAETQIQVRIETVDLDGNTSYSLVSVINQ